MSDRKHGHHRHWWHRLTTSQVVRVLEEDAAAKRDAAELAVPLTHVRASDGTAMIAAAHVPLVIQAIYDSLTVRSRRPETETLVIELGRLLSALTYGQQP